MTASTVPPRAPTAAEVAASGAPYRRTQVVPPTYLQQYDDPGSSSVELDSAAERLSSLRLFVPGEYEDKIPCTPVRPLGRFSDLVVERLGELTEKGRARELSAMQIYATFEAYALEVDDDVVQELLEQPGSFECSIARLDLAFAERAVAVAFAQQPGGDGSATWRAIRGESRLFDLATRFAEAEGSHPLLSWPDIGSRHPILDPRSFLPPGRSRDQEVYMYRVQHAMDHGYRAIVLALTGDEPSEEAVEKALAITEGIMRLMGHLNRVRDSGEFDKLDPYLGENGEVTGHGTGAFSVWVLLASYLLRGQATMRDRLLLPANQQAFDADGLELVHRVATGEIRPLTETAPGPARDRLDHYVKGFHAAHLAAVAKHATTSLDVPAPALPGSTNRESMKAAVAS